MNKLGRFVAVLALFGSWAAPSVAAPIAPTGTTDVTVADAVLIAFEGLGISASALSPAMQTGATFAFPITGGETEPLLITHSGGLQLSQSATSFIQASDFVIDGVANTVSATVSGSALASPVTTAVFDLVNPTVNSGITVDLLINATLNDALSATFAGGSDLSLTGVTFGSANTAPAPIPLPATGLLLIAGIAGLAAMRRLKPAA